MKKHFADGETLPNGIFVHRRVIFNALSGNDEEFPWLASISIASWYYCQDGETKEKAVENLFEYMKSVKVQFQDIIRIKTEQIEAVDKFLETKNEQINN